MNFAASYGKHQTLPPQPDAAVNSAANEPVVAQLGIDAQAASGSSASFAAEIRVAVGLPPNVVFRAA
jgi:hypothetical protein